MSVFAYASIALADPVPCYITLKYANDKNAPVKVRTGPGKDYPVAAYLTEGTLVYYVSGNGNNLDNWNKIIVPGVEGEYCYIQQKYLTDKKPSTPSEPEQGSANARYGSKNLKKGSKGSKVRVLQQDLKSLGYNIAVDGDFGAKTEKAVKAFQKAHKLTADGIVGPKTRLELYMAIKYR
ncbi:peptidoglycan-binding protein [Aristaeella lactis]|nr:peptidoglycan-binding protein [Aristaeella lactis]